MAEHAWLARVASYLDELQLTPTPAQIGLVEPAATTDLPAVVLSLESSARPGSGLGERVAPMTGALSWQAVIDLANPVLPDDPSFLLLDAGRTMLTLPHGGLVRDDGSSGAITDADLSVSVAGVARPVVTGAPTGLQVTVEPTIGRLRFATPLPAAGEAVVQYVLGQWERRVVRLKGVLRIDVCAANATDAAELGTAVSEALLDPAARSELVRLLSISLSSLSSVGPPEPVTSARRRTHRFDFLFDHEIDRPESSGGIIHEIPIHSSFVVES